MADKSGDMIEPVQEKPWQLERRMQEHHINRGSKYPPFSIEPVPYERQRLAGKGLSPEERLLRRQWVMDQELSPNEPRIMPELKPRNIFKRIYNVPMNILFKALEPVMGTWGAAMGRNLVPRILLTLGGVYVVYYNVKYHPNDWTRIGGFHVYESKPLPYRNQPAPDRNDPSDYCERGFKSRTALLDGKTSAAE
ncbi:uncharacterized protein LOC121375800 [Gigantopelta aegis]|uniref:uncharacterized protein LOC121375800 n=1 Tax=Gigantopelta aegis TaxID=1735272 RepID=UPI001B88CA7A|nr:uncharacterized protein LOC121375800 [Gigantopelta aegis]